MNSYYTDSNKQYFEEKIREEVNKGIQPLLVVRTNLRLMIKLLFFCPPTLSPLFILNSPSRGPYTRLGGPIGPLEASKIIIWPG